MRGLIRKAGGALRNFDDAYAARVRDDSSMLPATKLLGGTPLGAVEASPASELAMNLAMDGQGPASMGAIRRHQAVEYGLGAGIVAANAGYRYGLPAAGMTLAGVALNDLSQQFGGPADQPESAALSIQA